MTRLAIIAALLATPAAASPCFDAMDARQAPAEKYGEQIQVIGEAVEGRQIVLFANRDTGTWTIMEMTGRAACYVSSGHGVWFAEAPEGDPA